MASSFLRFLDHTQRRTTVGRTPLDKRSARRRDLSLATQYSQQTPMPSVGFEPTISAGERPQTYALYARPLGPAFQFIIHCYTFIRLHTVRLTGVVVKETLHNKHSFHYTPNYVATERLSEVTFNKGNRQKTITWTRSKQFAAYLPKTHLKVSNRNWHFIRSFLILLCVIHSNQSQPSLLNCSAKDFFFFV
jgi:hypothetical protein